MSHRAGLSIWVRKSAPALDRELEELRSQVGHDGVKYLKETEL